jgi:disulfide oxidoreductase YuzD
MKDIKWLLDVEEHDYPAAESYLSLLFDEEMVKDMIEALRNSDIKEFKAKDIFRASKLSLLGVSNSHVVKNIKKIEKGKAISPLLLVKYEENKLIIADGYHRLCAIYSYDEDALIPCKII